MNTYGKGVIVGLVALLAVLYSTAADTVWQWSVPTSAGRAYLWVPEKCKQVRAMVLAQNNMIERGILEHPQFRATLSKLGMAEVFIVPSIDPVYQFDKGAAEKFDGILGALATESGYGEISSAPIVPMGHSAHASFPWNFAAFNSDRTLAVLSLKGDAPLTDLTGSGRPNPDWGDRNLDGVPGLFVMSEYEWWEARLAPLLKFRAAHPAAPIALLADVGHGHFDATDSLVDFLTLFLRKAAAARLPREGTNVLRAVDPAKGWLVDRWRGDEPARAAAAPASRYTSDRSEAFWCFDKEMARATEAYYKMSRGKKIQQVSFMQAGAFVPIANTHGGIELKFLPEADGQTFRLEAGFIKPIPSAPRVATKDKRPERTEIQPVQTALDTHASGPVRIVKIAGPVAEIATNTFRIALDRMFSPQDERTSEVWLLAKNSGDAQYKSAVQQALLKLPRNADGAAQKITFELPASVSVKQKSVELRATSDAGLSVSYFVREGPGVIEGSTLRLTPIPPRAKFPIKLTVVAWQWGRADEPKVQFAAPVERTTEITW